MSIPQQINFAGKLDEDDGATMFFTGKFSAIFYSNINFL